MPLARRMPVWKHHAAKEMRRDPTPAEARLWTALRGMQAGVKFRRQVPMLGYIADFYAPKAKLVVEVDGPIHTPARDAPRDAAMQAHGFTVLRVTNREVFENLDGVLETIRRALPTQRPLTSVSCARCHYQAPTWAHLADHAMLRHAYRH